MTPVVIATRCLDSALGEIRVSLLRPEAVGADVRIRYRIEGPRLRRDSHAFGVDGIQALDLALRKIGIELRMSEEFAAGPIRWLDFDEPGFPLPAGCKDLGWARL